MQEGFTPQEKTAKQPWSEAYDAEPVSVSKGERLDTQYIFTEASGFLTLLFLGEPPMSFGTRMPKSMGPSINDTSLTPETRDALTYSQSQRQE